MSKNPRTATITWENTVLLSQLGQAGELDHAVPADEQFRSSELSLPKGAPAAAPARGSAGPAAEEEWAGGRARPLLCFRPVATLTCQVQAERNKPKLLLQNYPGKSSYS